MHFSTSETLVTWAMPQHPDHISEYGRDAYILDRIWRPLQSLPSLSVDPNAISEVSCNNLDNFALLLVDPKPDLSPSPRSFQAVI